MTSGFAQWVADSIHENAPGHSVQAVRVDLLRNTADEMQDLYLALSETWRVLRLAGLHNLSNGVQLGQISWLVKIADAESVSERALAKARGEA